MWGGLEEKQSENEGVRDKKGGEEAGSSEEEAQDKVERWEVIASIIENRKMGCVRAFVRRGNKVTPSSLHPTFQRSPVKCASAKPVHLNGSLLPLWQQAAAVLQSAFARLAPSEPLEPTPDSVVAFAFDPSVSWALSLTYL